jgi:pectate lyase
MIIGGKGRNILNGSNDILLGVGEQDRLIGSNLAIKNTFILGNATTCYYLGNGDNDFATISKYNPTYDTIQLNGSAVNYSLSFANNINSLYRLTTGGGTELIARISTSTVLTLSSGFTFVGTSAL